MNTIPFGPRNPPEDPLLAKAAELPKEIAPPRDLWPGIAARIADAGEAPAKPAFRWPLALAAGLAVASVSALLTWGIVRDPQTSKPAVIAGQTAPADGFVPVSYGPNSGLTANELAVRDELFSQFRVAFETLRPETREAIVKNLAVMQEAANQIDAALARDPASGMLKGMLVGTYKQELQLYSTVVSSHDGHTRRT
jgi:hypothetical protein